MGARLLVNVTEQFLMATRPVRVRAIRRSATATGVNFRVNDPPLLLGQIQYAWNNKKGDPNLTGQFKLGGWRHFGSFAGQRLPSNGASLAAPTSSGDPLLLSGDIGGWAVFEQQIYRVPRSDDRVIGMFARAASGPADRNLIDLYADAGVELIGLRDDRPYDKFGSRQVTPTSRSGHRLSIGTIEPSSIRSGPCETSRDF
jgi:porin